MANQTKFIKLKPVSSDITLPKKRVKERRIVIGKQYPLSIPVLVGILLISVLLYISFVYTMHIPQQMGAIVAALFGIAALISALAIVPLPQYERAVVQRYGKFDRVAGPGWSVIIPGIETYNVVDIRTKALDLLGYEAITKDKVRMYLDIVVYAKIVDPYKAVLAVKDINEAVITLVKAVTRDVVGNLEVNEVIADIGKVNELVKQHSIDMKDDWGVEIVSIEIQEIRLPESVQKSMHQLRSAEYEKQVMEQKAFGREKMINAIQRAASKLDNPALSYMYLEALKQVANGKATKIIFPMELTRLAESVSKNFGGNKEEFLKDIMKAYKEVVAEGK
jgi:regulator of protease activity HflC (stomatin/prohibitin superfamily)